MARKIDLRQNGVLGVADDYLFGSDVLPMFGFDLTSDMYLK